MNAEDRKLLLDHEKIAEQKKEYEQKAAEHAKYLDDWRETLSTPQGRRVIWDLIWGLKFRQVLFNTDPLIMASNCGKHEAALLLVRDIEEANPGIIFRMQNEYRSAQANKDR